jgi:2-polyprenyl-3-methyl-5-hydroxy-6-metoxy-1,4-benzoquinol methylase
MVRATWVPFYNFVFQLNSTKVPEIPVGKMLEIGCASGSYLKQMNDLGWEVQGVEFSPTAGGAAKEHGFKVFVGQLEDAPLPEGAMDLVVGWMVLEHLHDPISCLQKLSESTRPGGWLALSVPNAGSAEFSVFGRRWYALQLPAHLYHFTPETLRKTLNAGGWELKNIFHQRTLANVAGSLGLVLQDAGLVRLGRWFVDFPEKQGLLVYVLYPFAWFLSLFGQTGRMTVWAQPKE